MSEIIEARLVDDPHEERSAVIRPEEAIKTKAAVTSVLGTVAFTRTTPEVRKAIEDGVSNGLVLNPRSLEAMSNILGVDSEAAGRFATGYAAEKVTLTTLINDDTVRAGEDYAAEIGVTPIEVKVLSQTLHDEGSITKNELMWIVNKRVPAVGDIPEVRAHLSLKAAEAKDGAVVDSNHPIPIGQSGVGVRSDYTKVVNSSNIAETYGITWEKFVEFDQYKRGFGDVEVDIGQDQEPELELLVSRLSRDKEDFGIDKDGPPRGPITEGFVVPTRESAEFLTKKDPSKVLYHPLPLKSELPALAERLKSPDRKLPLIRTVERFLGREISPDISSEEISGLIKNRTIQVMAERKAGDRIKRGEGPAQERMPGRPTAEQLRVIMERANESRRAFVASKSTSDATEQPRTSTDSEPHPEPESEHEPANAPPFGLHELLDGTVSVLTAFLATGQADGWLEDLHRAEYDRKNRATAFAAIEDRFKITNPGEDMHARDYSRG